MVCVQVIFDLLWWILKYRPALLGFLRCKFFLRGSEGGGLGTGEGVGGLPVVIMYISWCTFFRVLMPWWRPALLPWDILCSPGRIAWEGDEQTDRQTLRLLDRIGLRGQFGEKLFFVFWLEAYPINDQKISTSFNRSIKQSVKNRARGAGQAGLVNCIYTNMKLMFYWKFYLTLGPWAAGIT